MAKKARPSTRDPNKVLHDTVTMARYGRWYARSDRHVVQPRVQLVRPVSPEHLRSTQQAATRRTALLAAVASGLSIAAAVPARADTPAQLTLLAPTDHHRAACTRRRVPTRSVGARPRCSRAGGPGLVPGRGRARHPRAPWLTTAAARRYEHANGLPVFRRSRPRLTGSTHATFGDSPSGHLLDGPSAHQPRSCSPRTPRRRGGRTASRPRRDPERPGPPSTRQANRAVRRSRCPSTGCRSTAHPADPSRLAPRRTRPSSHDARDQGVPGPARPVA